MNTTTNPTETKTCVPDVGEEKKEAEKQQQQQEREH